MYKAISDLRAGLVPAEADVLNVVPIQSRSDSIATGRDDFADLPEHTVAIYGTKPCIRPGQAGIALIQFDYQVSRLTGYRTPQPYVVPIEIVIDWLCRARSSPVKVVNCEFLGLLLSGSKEPYQACSPKRNVYHRRKEPVEESKAYINNKK